jgi:integrase
MSKEQVPLTAKTIVTVPPGKDRAFHWDSSLRGFGLMTTSAGASSYVIQYRNIAGKTRRMTIDPKKAHSLAAAKREAKILLGAVAKGHDPLGEKYAERLARAGTLRVVFEQYMSDPAVEKLRSADEKRAVFERHVLKPLGPKQITEIKRSEIVRLLGDIQRDSGGGAATVVYKLLSRLFTWYAPRSDNFHSPIVKGVFTKVSGDGARSLADDEIRIIWNVASEGKGPYDRMIQFALLTGTRLNEAARMSRSELSADGLDWTIPAARYKVGHAHLIPLSRTAREILDSIPVVGDWVFTTDGKKPISGFSNYKLAFDAHLTAALAAEGDATRDRIVADLNARYPGKRYTAFDGKWTTHSLRKSARTLLSRAGVDQVTAERCMGHVVGGIVGTYNHDDHKEPKRIAFEKLAREIERIVSGKSANVVSFAKASST